MGVFDLSFLDWVFSGLGHMALLMVKDAVEGCAVILFTIVLGTMANSATKTIPGYTSTVFSSMIILIIPKVLYNIIATIK